MTRTPEDKARLDRAIIADEIGIESGGYGIYRLRCMYQPIFTRRGRTLHAVALEGRAVPYVAGEEVPDEVFLSAIAEADHAFVARMRLALELRNLANAGPDDLRLLIRVGRERGGSADQAALVDFVAEELAGAGLAADLAWLAIGEHAAAADGWLAGFAETARGAGMRVAVGDFGTGRWSDAQLAALSPDMVRIDGDWFRKICRDAVTVRLFETVVGRLRERGLKVMVAGIDTETQFGVALHAGADLFQGSHLGPGAHVGVAIRETVALREKLSNADKIVPLYG